MPTQETVVAKIKRLELDTQSAQKWANDGNIEAWVHKFLLSETGGSTNAAFSESLKREKRWWRGPIKINLNKLSPAVGTTPGMEYVVEEDDWQAWTTALAEGFTELSALPPLIAEYRAGALSVRDGNTRLGAMRLLGWSECWVIIWYNSEEEFKQHNQVANE